MTLDAARARTSTGPALSPLIALLGGATLVLLVGLLRPRAACASVLVPAAGARRASAPPSAWAIWQYGDARRTSSPARCASTT